MATPINLGNVIPSGRIRQIIYGSYVVALLITGALQAWYVDPDPEWLTQINDVVTYLGIPVGTLALANASTGKPISSEALVAAQTAVDELPHD